MTTRRARAARARSARRAVPTTIGKRCRTGVTSPTNQRASAVRHGRRRPRATLARVGGAGPAVGRYRVRVDALDSVAVPALVAGPDVRLLVVDEIGRMECLSPRFCDAVRDALDGPIPVVGTIARRGGGFIAE